MPLVNAKCSNCGAILIVDDNKEAAICDFCGSAYIVEKAVQNYKIQNQYNINADVVNIFNNQEESSVSAEKSVDDDSPEYVCFFAFLFSGHNKSPNRIIRVAVMSGKVNIFKKYIKFTDIKAMHRHNTNLYTIRYCDIDQLFSTQKYADTCLNLTMKNGEKFTLCLINHRFIGDNAAICREAIEKNWKSVKGIN